MSEKKSVLFLSSWYPTRVDPTDGNFNEKFAEAAALYNHVDVIHVCADASLQKPFEIVHSETGGVKNHMLYFKKREKGSFADKVIKAFHFLRYYFMLYRIYSKKNGKPDVIHLNIVFPVGLIVLLLNKLYKIPYVISENWTGYLPANYIKQGFVNAFLRRAIVKNASVLMPVTINLKNAMLRHGYRNRYEIVPNVTNPKLFYPPEKNNDAPKKVILHVSTLKDEHKNISGLLDVTKRLSLIRQDFELHIVGDGDPRPHIARAQELSILDTFVHFFSAMRPDEIADKMRDSDFFVLFSNHENLPCVLVESFACGLPIISTNVGGVSEHLTPDKGIIIEPRDEEALLKSSLHMLDHCRMYVKKDMNKYALDNFSYSSVGKKLTGIYDSVINS